MTKFDKERISKQHHSANLLTLLNGIDKLDLVSDLDYNKLNKSFFESLS